MRALIMTGLLLASMGATARDMFVVIHTRDAQVEVYRCARVDGNSPAREAMTRRVVRAPGSAIWHVVGGVPPYTVIDRRTDHPGSVSVTVMDAVGNVATGHGIIGTIYTHQTVTCPMPQDPCDTDVLTAFTQGGSKEEECAVTNPAPPPKTFDRTRTLASSSSRDHGTVDRTRTLRPTTSRDGGTGGHKPSPSSRTPDRSPSPTRYRSVPQVR